ncbi:sialidase family protein, partial [Phytoactinopolyspora endophytica]|uniref:sialidase family protein n=1 Tax=Phytoactinopolyspora endophytica TaxID=1642495 RepID=UPI0013EA5F8B
AAAMLLATGVLAAGSLVLAPPSATTLATSTPATTSGTTAPATSATATSTYGATTAALHAASQTTPPAEGREQAAASEHGSFDETVLWDAETDPLENYHVHGLAVTPNDTILAFTEGRHETCDAGPRELLLRRSTDGGETFEPSQVVVPSDDGQSWGNPSAVVDEETGDIFLFFGLSLQDDGNTTCSGDRQEIYMVRSSDDGQTWTDPVEMPELFEGNEYEWTLHGPGPGHGIQLDDGRLVMQALHRREVVGHSVAERLYGVSMIYSDDHGETWQAGDAIPVDINYPINESRIWQREDGAVVVNGRSASGGHRDRISAVSTDGGLTWSDPVLEPATGRYTTVDAGFVRFEGPDGEPRTLHSRPDSARREALTIGVSYDEGYTYRYQKTVNAGPSYYSDLAVLSDGTIVLIYGRDGEILSAPQRVAVATFDLEWLTDGRDDGTGDGPGITEHEVELGTSAVRTSPESHAPARTTITPDASGQKNHATVTGSPEVVDGVVDSALAMDPDDELEVPLSESLTDAGEIFTAAAWFRSESPDSQAIMWAYGQGSSTPQWWVRLEPGNNRVRALLDTGGTTRSAVAPGDFADGEWHHVALTRSADAVTLYVDGDVAAETDGLVGSTSSDARTGLHIGKRPDGANPLDGAADEVRLYDRALSADEVADLATGNVDDDADDDGAAVRLPMDEVRQHVERPERPEVVDDENARGAKALTYG